ncbi:MAG: hypothetical protein ACR2JY_21005 [Chloroflexota bacterium]
MSVPSPDRPPAVVSAVQPVVYYFARDLFFGVRLAEGLARLALDGRPITVATAATLTKGAVLSIIDLSAPTPQWQPLLEAAHAATVPVLAFGSHMDQERWQLARRLGADRIVANSQLMEHFTALVERMIGLPGATASSEL